MKLSKQCKRILSLVLAVLFLASSVPTSVYAADAENIPVVSSVADEAQNEETASEAPVAENEETGDSGEEVKQEDKNATVTEEQSKAEVENSATDGNSEGEEKKEQNAEVKDQNEEEAAAQPETQANESDLNAVADEEDPVAETPIVEDMKIIAGEYSADDSSKYVDALDGKFKVGTREYNNIVLTEDCRYVYVKLSDEIKKKGDVSYEISYNGESYGSKILKENAETGMTESIELDDFELDMGESIRVEIKIGTKQDKVWDLYETYIFNVQFEGNLGNFQVIADGSTVETTPGSNSGTDTFASTFEGIVPIGTQNVKLKVNDIYSLNAYVNDTLIPDNGNATIDIDLGKYITEDKSKAIIPLELKWTSWDWETVKTRNYTLKLSFADLPKITTQPKDVFCKKNADVTLTVETSESESGQLSYQWYAVNGKDNKAVIGATENSFTPMTSEIGETKYYCAITSNKNDQALTIKSNVVKVSVFEVNPPHILEQSENIICAKNAIVSIFVNTAEAEAGDVYYSWYEVGKNMGHGGSHLYKPDTSEIGVKEYYCRVGWKYNGVTYDIYSQNIKVTVDENCKDTNHMPVITKQPENISCNKGEQPVLTVEATGDGQLSYQWYCNAKLQQGATSPSFVPPTDSNVTASCYCEVTNTVDGKNIL